jgi:uncharacterized protein (TIGR02246 family)
MRTKTLATLVVLTCAAAACGGEPPPPPQPPPPPMAPPQPLSTAPTAEAPSPPPPKPAITDLVPQTLKNVTDAFNAHDAQKFAANFSSDVAGTAYGMPEMHGRDDVVKNLQQLFDMSSDVKAGAARLFAKGNVIAVDWVSAGTMTGDFMGMKASKKPFGGHRLVVCWLNDDGLMTQTHEYADVAGMMAQVKGAKDAPAVPTVPTSTEFHWAKNTPEEDKLADWVKTSNDAFNKDDAKAVSALFAPDGDLTFYTFGGKTIKGPKELEKFHGDFLKAIPKAQFTISNAWAVDGYVIAERTVSGTQKGRLGPLPASNKDVTLHEAAILQPTADGKVQHVWAYGNAAEIAPPPPPPPAPKAAAAPGAQPAPKGGPAAAPAAPAAKPAAPPAPAPKM